MADVDQWHIVTPKKRTNYVLNPVFGSTNGYVGQGVNTAVDRDGTLQLFDKYSLEVTTAVDNDGVAIQTDGATGGGNFICFNNGTFDATDGTEATAETGGLLMDTGKRGIGYYADAALTNIVTQPSFEGSLVLWSAAGTGATAVRSTDRAYVGDYSLLVNGGAAVGTGARTDTTTIVVSGSTDYTIQCKAFITAGSWQLRALWYNGGSLLRTDGSDALSAASDWQDFTTLSDDFVVTSPATANRLRLQFYDTAGSSTAYFDAVCVTATGYKPPYFDGSFTGAAWSSTAHNSTSTKAAAGVTYAAGLINGAEGSISFWVKPYDTSAAAYFLSNATSTTEIYLSSGLVGVDWGSISLLSSTTLVAGNWYHVRFDYSGTAARLYINDVLEDSSTGMYASPIVGVWNLGHLSGNEARALITDIAIYDDYEGTTTDYAASFYSTASALTVASSAYAEQDLTGTDIDGTWYEYAATIENTGVPWLYIMQTGATGSTWNLDGVQVEQLDSASDERTTFIYGDLAGDYRWIGQAHNSQSKRGAFESSGGYVRSFRNDFDFLIEYNTGAAMVPIDVLTDNTPGVDGSAFNNIEVRERDFELRGRLIDATNTADFHHKRGRIMRAMHSFNGGARRLWYKGAAISKYVDAYYVNGLEGGVTRQVTNEELALRMLAIEPYFYETGTRSQSLEIANTIAIEAGFTARIDGSWDTLTQPSSVGGNDDVYALLRVDDRIYIGGDFTNWDGDADADNFTWYNIPTDTYGSPPAFTTGIIYDMKADAENNVIIGAASGIFAFDGTSNTQSIVGSPSPNANGAVRSVSISPINGDIWIAGAFTSIDGVSCPGGVAYYDGASWNSPTASATGTVDNRSVLVGGDGTVYLGMNDGDGTYTVAGLDGPIISYNGTSWSQYYTLATSGLNTKLAETEDRTIYFSVLDEVRTVDDGLVLNTTVAGEITRLVAHGNSLYVLGGIQSFEDGDNTITAFGAVLLNGGNAVPLPYPALGTLQGNVRDIVLDGDDVYLGFEKPNTTITAPGENTVTYTGSAPSVVNYEFTQTSGNTTLHQIYNVDTGQAIYIDDYELKAGEKVTISFENKTVAVTSSFAGAVPNLILSGSDDFLFTLAPAQEGTEQDTNIHVITSGATTCAAFATWQNRHLGQD